MAVTSGGGRDKDPHHAVSAEGRTRREPRNSPEPDPYAFWLSDPPIGYRKGFPGGFSDMGGFPTE
jgi:hypothetical protein